MTTPTWFEPKNRDRCSRVTVPSFGVHQIWVCRALTDDNGQKESFWSEILILRISRSHFCDARRTSLVSPGLYPLHETESFVDHTCYKARSKYICSFLTRWTKRSTTTNVANEQHHNHLRASCRLIKDATRDGRIKQQDVLLPIQRKELRAK